MKHVLEVFFVALRLGFTAFGGPVAHVGYFREEYVEQRKWLSEESFAELMSITQFIPGPGSSQLGAAIGYKRAGWLGGFAAWFGFTLPSALFLIGFAIGIGFLAEGQLLWIQGLAIAALGVVVNAVVGMREKLCKGVTDHGIAIVALAALVFLSHPLMQPLVIAVGAVFGMLLYTKKEASIEVDGASSSSSWVKKWCVSLVLVGVVVGIPFLLNTQENLREAGGIFKAGSLVFGGGHVVLPMLEAEVVGDGLLSKGEFLAGYGMTQAMPGPVFTLAAYLGAKLPILANPWIGGAVGILAIFLPGMLLLAACVPIWNNLKHKAWARAAMRGANASVVGLLGAAVVHLLTKGTLEFWWEWVMVFACFFVLKRKLIPAWALVLVMTAFGVGVYQF